MPVLHVASGWRLLGDLEALQNGLPLDRTGQVQPLANGPCRGQQFIGRKWLLRDHRDPLPVLFDILPMASPSDRLVEEQPGLGAFPIQTASARGQWHGHSSDGIDVVCDLQPAQERLTNADALQAIQPKVIRM